MQLVTVRETHRGLSKSSNYHYVIEYNKIVHISHYAVLERRLYRDVVEYIVDLDRLRGKNIIEIISSNSGLFCSLTSYPAEELALEYSKRSRKWESLSKLNNHEFTHITRHEKIFLETDWKKYYLPMAKELRGLAEFIREYGKSFFTLPSLTQCQVDSGAEYPLSFLIPYSEKARRRSLESLTKELHQVWIAVILITQLSRTIGLERLALDFSHSSTSAVASFNCKEGLCSLWYEFDMNPHTMCRGMLWYDNSEGYALKQFYRRALNALRRMGLKRAPLRPDITIIVGAETCDELKRGFKVKVIVECKNWDYEYWAHEVNSQLIPYKEIFKPDALIVASLKKVPQHFKNHLARQGIVVVDEVYPGGKGIDELVDIVEYLLT